jgi:hypothetical protein
MSVRARRLRPQAGAFLLLASLFFALALVALFAAAAFQEGRARERITERALARAREALIAYAADRPIDAVVGPGYLPCPDLDGDGWAEATCGSLDGASGQEQRLGRLPWKTLGLPMLTDADGERLWYAVSTKYKGLLNCAASRACVDMSPAAALGTITVRDASGRPYLDGTLAIPGRSGGAVALVIAPGAILERLEADGSRRAQRRVCAPGDCDAEGACTTRPPQRAATCDPRNYLDRAPPAASGEDNARFVDRSDAAGRREDTDGFIAGPIAQADGEVVVNDRIAAVGYMDVMPAILRRVAAEAAHCLRFYGTRPENGGRYPWPAASCREGAAFGAAPDRTSASLGTIADTPFARSVDSSDGRMLERWWRATSRVPEALAELPTAADACRIAVAPADPGPVRSALPGTPLAEAGTAGFDGIAWWTTWRPYVSYALADRFAPDARGTPQCAPGGCISLADGTGRTIARDRAVALVASVSCTDAPRCDPARGCAQLRLDDDAAGHGLAFLP